MKKDRIIKLIKVSIKSLRALGQMRKLLESSQTSYPQAGGCHIGDGWI